MDSLKSVLVGHSSCAIGLRKWADYQRPALPLYGLRRFVRLGRYNVTPTQEGPRTVRPQHLFAIGPNMAPATVDAVLDKLSRTHAVIFVFAFMRGLPVTWNLMMPVFVAPSAVLFRCADDPEMAANWTSMPANSQLWRINSSFSTVVNDTEQCFRRAESAGDSETCTSWVYDRSVYGKTVTEEWDMVCSNRWMTSFVQSIYLAGMVVGTVAASHISDWFGRKWTIIGGLLLSAGASAMTAFSTSAAMYYASRFVMALSISGYADVIYTLIMETVSPRGGRLSSTRRCHWCRCWRSAKSPRWLMATGRFPAAKQVVAKFAKHGETPAHLVDEIIEEAKRKKAAVSARNEAGVIN
ncbi:hypothetical protein V5799_010862 [Amblyomma americanum]|uniref:Uncharacterized protein n=1 Tax=Amblyomma americanum TaxID=6943 RepID=A0AAQ4EII6_AMBAM